jgi:hypothetical protein
MPDKIAGVMRPQGMTLPMMQAPFVTSRTARAATLLAALLTAAAPLAVQAQDMRGSIGRAPQAAQPAAPVEAAPPAPPPAPASLAPAQMSESVAAVVNDEIISTYDLAQRMRLLIATSGVQPTQDNLIQFQREALSSLIDERLQLQELRPQEKEQKIDDRRHRRGGHRRAERHGPAEQHESRRSSSRPCASPGHRQGDPHASRSAPR